MTPENTYHRRGRDECRACNRDQKARARQRARERAPALVCACGCGTEIPGIDSNGRPRRYALGHTNKGGSNTWLVKETVLWRSSHARAAKLKRDVMVCGWERIGSCMGPLGVAHVDGDEFNNESVNLLKLCQAHHALLDNGRIDPAAPVMPAFKVGSGKRRYERAG